VCHERWPHCEHDLNQRGSPAACQRTPPNSQMDLAQPHEHRTIHERDSASSAATQRRGNSATHTFWSELMTAISPAPGGKASNSVKVMTAFMAGE